MDYFAYRGKKLMCENVAVSALAAEHGTPLYVYSAGTLRHHLRRINEAFAAVSPLVCYSVKANSNLGVLKVLKDAGAGFDIVSGGELHRVLKVGGDPSKVVFAGVGKTDSEIRGALEAGIKFFNVESESEVLHIDDVATKTGRKAAIAIRVNPDVAPDTHRYIVTGKKETKFGLDVEKAAATAAAAARLRSLEVRGVHMHIGSQILDAEPYAAALERVLKFASSLKAEGHPLDTVNVGGGFGITYDDREAPAPEEFAKRIVPQVRASGLKLILEPGRFIVGNAGILVARVIYVKESGSKVFAITDAGMNDLIRPSLYGAFHRIWPVEGPLAENVPESALIETDVVGPICESGDFLAKGRLLPRVERDDLLAVFSAGAYGFSMSSNYNSRPRAAEVMVDGNSSRIVRKRETYDDLVRGESTE